MKKLIPMILCAALSFSMIGCGSVADSAKNEEKLNIVSTTTMLTDLALEIGQDKVTVVPLMGPELIRMSMWQQKVMLAHL